MSIEQKIGILGGGQLGKMLAIEAARWHVHVEALDPTPGAPASPVVHHMHLGSFKDYDDVLTFGRKVDVVGIEIEHVNTDALRQLMLEGKTVIPHPDTLDIIKDKGKQKLFYRSHDLPTSPFELYESKDAILEAIRLEALVYPFVQKTRQAGYDGKGVAVIRNEEDLYKLLDGPSVIENAVDIDKELAIIVARNGSGEIKTFPVVEMLFNPEANLVENLICPADITGAEEAFIEDLAVRVALAYDIQGLLAIELFLDTHGEILINEVAPRPHNSGHHTIEACITCQYQQQIRALLNLPLGDTTLIQPAMMLNLLGSEGHEGPVYYKGLEDALHIPGVFVHIYGKTTTKPYRKMGHITITTKEQSALYSKAEMVRNRLKVISSQSQSNT
jgi:5-(carboxyamino)imidazole ribonucleotide synthase